MSGQLFIMFIIMFRAKLNIESKLESVFLEPSAIMEFCLLLKAR